MFAEFFGHIMECIAPYKKKMEDNFMGLIIGALFIACGIKCIIDWINDHKK